MIDEGSWRYRGWRVVAVCFLLAVFAWGFGFYGHGFYLAELTRTRGWPASSTSAATTAFYLPSALLGAFIGEALDRFGTRVVILTGIACIVLAASLIPLTTSIWQLYAAYVLLAFGWAATSLSAITTVLGAWFREKRGLAISLGLTGASFGGICVVPLLTYAAQHVGFASATIAVAITSGLIVAGLALAWLPREPPFIVSAKDDEATPVVRRGELLRTRTFWLVSGPFALAFFAQVGFLVHQIALLEPTLGRPSVGFAVAITTASAVCGRFVLGLIIDRLDQRLAAALCFASQACALCAVATFERPVPLVIACAVFGFSVGNIITLPALIIGREFSPASFAAAVGLSNAVCQTAYAFGPSVLGYLHDVTGDYRLPLWTCVVLDLLAALLALAGRRLVRRDVMDVRPTFG